MRTLPLALALALPALFASGAQAQQNTTYTHQAVPTAPALQYQATPTVTVPTQPLVMYEATVPLQGTYQLETVKPVEACADEKQKLKRALRARAAIKRRCERVLAHSNLPTEAELEPKPDQSTYEPSPNAALNFIFGVSKWCDDKGCYQTTIQKVQVPGHYPPDPPASDEAHRWLEDLLTEQHAAVVSMIPQGSLFDFERVERETCWNGLLHCKVNYRLSVIKAIMTDLAARS